MGRTNEYYAACNTESIMLSQNNTFKSIANYSIEFSCQRRLVLTTLFRRVVNLIIILKILLILSEIIS